MSFARSVLLLAGIVCSLAFVVLVGHAISTHAGRPVLLGAVLLGIGVALLTIYVHTGHTRAADGHG